MNRYLDLIKEKVIMKRMWKFYVIVLVTIQALLFVSCDQPHSHSYTAADCVHPATCTECGETNGEALGHTSVIGVCARCGEIGNEDILAKLNTNFEQMMEAGSPLFSCLSGILDLDVNAQYEKFLEADRYTATMASIYKEIIKVCINSDELNNIDYQINLLLNACPPPISGNDATSLANQGALYQLYLQQLSSSCNYISESLNYLAGNGGYPKEITYFEEVPEMPTPDSIIYDISYYSTQNAPGNIQYMYLLGDSETDATLNYNLFLAAIKKNTELRVENSDSMAMLSKNGNMVSVMLAGNDPSIGYFLTVSFHE